MNRSYLGAVAAAVVALAGCGKEGSSTAPGKNPPPAGPTQPTRTDEKRKLVVKAPTGQNVTQDQTTDFTVSVDRDNFAGPVDIELRNLPKGVSKVTEQMTIPAGQDSVKVTVKAAPDAPAVENHAVQVAAKAKDQKDLPEAVSDFKLDVKAKK